MPLRNDLLNPIPGDNPSGANIRYDPVTEKIKEARREELDLDQGAWKTAIKTADLPLVIKLGGDVLANRSKDLQIAVWLVDAHVRREGFVILAPALRFIRSLLEQFWDTLYPPIDEDGDMEVRAAPLTWLGMSLGEPTRPEFLGFLPIVSGKLSWVKYAESRKVGSEAAADTYEKQQARQTAIAEHKITAEQFDEAADATPLDKLKDTFKQLNEAKEAVESLIEYCDNQFGDFAPSFLKTRDILEEITQTVRIILGRRPGGLEEPAPEQPEEEIAEEPIADFSLDSLPVEEPAAKSVESVEDSSPAPTSSRASFGQPANRADVARQLASICRYLRTQDPSDPTPYAILRSFAWAVMMSNAPSIDQNKMEAPPSEVRVSLKRLTADSEWDKVLEITEAGMLQPYGRCWVDMQRFAVNALEQKSQPYIAKVLVNQLRLLLENLPDLIKLHMLDDTAVANEETKNWIEQFVIIRAMPPPPPPSPETSESTEEAAPDSFSVDETPSTDFSIDATPEPAPEPEPLPEPIPEPEPFVVEENPPILEAEAPPPTDMSDEFAVALAAVRDGRTAEGLGVITNILATERSGRARFRRRTQLAHLLMAAGKGKVAQPLLDQLAAEIDDRRLEDWEPSEALAYPLELLLHCLSSADDERRTQLYMRICKLDPVRAVNCSI